MSVESALSSGGVGVRRGVARLVVVALWWVSRESVEVVDVCARARARAYDDGQRE
jgi:hypothetical protein